jgi:hypothetical protein
MIKREKNFFNNNINIININNKYIQFLAISLSTFEFYLNKYIESKKI